MRNLFKFIFFCFLLNVIWAESIDKYTNKNSVDIRGLANKNVQVDIFVNKKKVKTVVSDSQGQWYAPQVPIFQDGENKIYAMARNKEGTTSKLSTKLNVFLDQQAPNIYEINVSPTEVKPKDVVEVSLKSDPDVQSAVVVMPDNSMLKLSSIGNETWQGKWRVPKLISGGDYNLMVVLTDRAGNVTQQDADEITIDAMPSLVITQPRQREIVYEQTISVKGYAKNSRYILINGEKNRVFKDYQFNGFATLDRPGRNQIVVQAYDNTGSVLESQLEVIRLITFDDIQTHWAKKEIEYLATLGFIEAYPHSRMFMPDHNITRAELAALLVRIKDLPTVYSDVSAFKDVKSQYWAHRYIETASKYGLVEGYPGDTFKPQNHITRAEAATMLVRFAGLPVADVAGDVSLDVGRDHWGAQYIAAFKAAGLMPPTWSKDNRFYPSKAITRAEVAAVLARIPEINRAIEELLGDRTDWNYVVDNSYYYEKQPAATSTSKAVVLNKNDVKKEASTLIIGVVSPQEVLTGKDLRLTVASLVRLKDVMAKFPDGTTLPLIYDKKTDLWEVNWKIPGNIKKANYSVEISGQTPDGKAHTAYSNEFAVVEEFSPVLKQKEKQKSIKQDSDMQEKGIAIDIDDVEFTYPEFEQAKEINFVANSAEGNKDISNSQQIYSGKALTRARLTEILAKYNKLRRAKVKAAPASDVSVAHPNVKTIKSAIVTGILPNISLNKFYPAGKVTKGAAVNVLRRAKISTKGISVSNKNDIITEREFDSWLAKSVK